MVENGPLVGCRKAEGRDENVKADRLDALLPKSLWDPSRMEW